MSATDRCIDFDEHLEQMKKDDPVFKKEFEEGYEAFKIGALLKGSRQKANLTQEQVAKRVNTTKNFISRLENHAKDVKFSTLCKYAEALGKKIEIRIV